MCIWDWLYELMRFILWCGRSLIHFLGALLLDLILWFVWLHETLNNIYSDRLKLIVNFWIILFEGSRNMVLLRGKNNYYWKDLCLVCAHGHFIVCAAFLVRTIADWVWSPFWNYAGANKQFFWLKILCFIIQFFFFFFWLTLCVLQWKIFLMIGGWLCQMLTHFLEVKITYLYHMFSQVSPFLFCTPLLLSCSQSFFDYLLAAD